MTLTDLYKHIAKHEGKKSQVKIGDIREIVGIISDLVYGDDKRSYETHRALWLNGKRRAKRKVRK